MNQPTFEYNATNSHIKIYNLPQNTTNVKIINMMGVIVNQIPAYTENLSVSTNNLPEGVYLVKCSTESGNEFIWKFIIK